MVCSEWKILSESCASRMGIWKETGAVTSSKYLVHFVTQKYKWYEVPPGVHLHECFLLTSRKCNSKLPHVLWICCFRWRSLSCKYGFYSFSNSPQFVIKTVMYFLIMWIYVQNFKNSTDLNFNMWIEQKPRVVELRCIHNMLLQVQNQIYDLS